MGCWRVAEHYSPAALFTFWPFFLTKPRLHFLDFLAASAISLSKRASVAPCETVPVDVAVPDAGNWPMTTIWPVVVLTCGLPTEVNRPFGGGGGGGDGGVTVSTSLPHGLTAGPSVPFPE